MSDETITACPRCNGPDIRERTGDRVETTWRCSECAHHFDEPVERQPIQVRSGLARQLEETDVDEVLPDGGHPTARPLDGGEYSAKLPADLAQQLEDLVGIGVYASRAEALRAALRRELRLQADEADPVSEQLQHCYDVAMQGRRPETIGSLEELAVQLGVDLERRVDP